MIHFDCDTKVLNLLPVLAVIDIECSNPACGEAHGWGMAIGWLFFTFYIGFPTGHK
jgi:hypothetical protein